MGAARPAQAADTDRLGVVRRHPLPSFFVLACAISWAYWIPLVVWAPEATHFPGLLGPMLAAVVLTALLDGGVGLRALSARAVRWRVPLRWYAAALAPVVVGVLALGWLAATGEGWPTWFELSTIPGVPDIGLLGLFAVLVVVNGYGEETGWRGYAWPRLRARHSLGVAALVLSVPWAIWHLPTFWLETGLADLGLATVPGWLVALPFGAIVLGWLYESAHSSLWVVALFHAAVNWASATLATAGLPAAVVSVVVVVAALVILRRAHSVARER